MTVRIVVGHALAELAKMPDESVHCVVTTEIPRRAILAGSQLGDTILDPFLGSGTTALVADRLGRNCIGIELSESYAAMARCRCEDDAGLFAEVAAECSRSAT